MRDGRPDIIYRTSKTPVGRNAIFRPFTQAKSMGPKPDVKVKIMKTSELMRIDPSKAEN